MLVINVVFRQLSGVKWVLRRCEPFKSKIRHKPLAGSLFIPFFDLSGPLRHSLDTVLEKGKRFPFSGELQLFDNLEVKSAGRCEQLQPLALEGFDAVQFRQMDRRSAFQAAVRAQEVVVCDEQRSQGICSVKALVP